MNIAFETLVLIDQPYVSDTLQTTIRDQSLPVVDTPAARSMGLMEGALLMLV